MTLAEGSSTQISVLILISQVALIALLALRPYKAQSDNSAAVVAQAGLVLAMFSQLLLRVDVAGENERDMHVFDFVLVCSIVGVPVFAIVETGYNYAQAYKKKTAVGSADGEGAAGQQCRAGGGGAQVVPADAVIMD